MIFPVTTNVHHHVRRLNNASTVVVNIEYAIFRVCKANQVFRRDTGVRLPTPSPLLPVSA